jgi:F0F1-type ATP synthase assembly protein I
VTLPIDEGGAEMKKGIAAIVAISTVIFTSFGGMIVGAIVGNLIVPARLDWTGVSGPGLLLVGAFLGLIGGFVFGIRAAMRIVDDAAAARNHRPDTRV